MKTNVLLSVLLSFLTFAPASSVSAQVVAEFTEDNRYVPLNSEFAIEIHIRNFPTKGTVLLKRNGVLEKFYEADIRLAYKDSALGEYKVDLELEVVSATKSVYKTSKSVYYTRFQPYVSIECSRGVFYRNIENTFTVSVSGIPSSDVQITDRLGLIRKIEGNAYSFTPGNADTVIKIQISAKLGNGTVIAIERRVLPLMVLPRPQISLFRSLQDLVIADTEVQINLAIAGFPDIKPRATSYTVLLYSNGIGKEYNGSGEIISSELLEAMKAMNTGDWICFRKLEYTLNGSGGSGVFTMDASLIVK